MRVTSRRNRTIATVGAMTLGGAVAVAPAAHAGLIDGSLNNANVFSGANMLGVMLNSNIGSSANNNANSRTAASANTSYLFHSRPTDPTPGAASGTNTCRLTVTAHDPNGAVGTATVDVPQGEAQTPVLIEDATPKTPFAAGHADHLTGDIVCTDNTTGAMTGMVDVTTDLVAS